MALIVCPLCVREDEVFLLRTLPDGRKEAECRDCDFTFVYGTAAPPEQSKDTRPAVLLRQFPTAADVAPADRERAEDLKREFLATVFPQPDPKVAPYWAKYQWVFSSAGLDKAVISDLKSFANDPTGVYPGIMSEFNKAWNLLGELEGARRVRAVTEQLLRGPGAIEDRLTQLINGDFALSMPGWKEALLTKTLAVVEPDRFLTIVTYDQRRAMASSVFGIDLPEIDKVAWTIGRLAVWSNDLLVELLGDGFVDQQHAAEFLWWAKDQ